MQYNNLITLIIYISVMYTIIRVPREQIMLSISSLLT